MAKTTTTSTFPEWIIKENSSLFSIKMTKEYRLGSGANGAVFVAQYCGAKVAAKSFFALQNPEMYGLDDENIMQHVVAEIKQEMEIQSRLHHPNILPFFGAVFDSNNFP